MVQLPTGGAPTAFDDPPVPDQITVAVEPLETPQVAVAVDRCVEVLDLDRRQAARSEQQLVDLTAAAAVAADQRPLVVVRVGKPNACSSYRT